MKPRERERYEVLPTPDALVEAGERAWTSTRDGEVLTRMDTQQEAVDLTVRVCRLRLKFNGRTSELVIKGTDGRIRDSRTYGDDPESTPG